MNLAQIQDLLGPDPFFQQMTDPRGNDPGLSGARPCQDQDRAFCGGNGFALGRVEVREAHGEEKKWAGVKKRTLMVSAWTAASNGHVEKSQKPACRFGGAE